MCDVCIEFYGYKRVMIQHIHMRMHTCKNANQQQYYIAHIANSEAIANHSDVHICFRINVQFFFGYFEVTWRCVVGALSREERDCVLRVLVAHLFLEINDIFGATAVRTKRCKRDRKAPTTHSYLLFYWYIIGSCMRGAWRNVERSETIFNYFFIIAKLVYWIIVQF